MAIKKILSSIRRAFQIISHPFRTLFSSPTLSHISTDVTTIHKDSNPKSYIVHHKSYFVLRTSHIVLCTSYFVLLFFFSSCEETIYTPKPRGFPRVVYPEKAYQPFNENYCQFTFQYPKYALIQRDTLFFDEKPPSDCWFNIQIPSLNATVHCSYYAIDKTNTYEKLRADAFALAGKHNSKADYIDELPIKKPNNVSGFVFDIQGPAASPFQFYLSDSTHHFLRGALYFNAQVRPDSLAPVFDFVKKDVMEMINTFEWRK